MSAAQETAELGRLTTWITHELLEYAKGRDGLDDAIIALQTILTCVIGAISLDGVEDVALVKAISDNALVMLRQFRKDHPGYKPLRSFQ